MRVKDLINQYHVYYVFLTPSCCLCRNLYSLNYPQSCVAARTFQPRIDWFDAPSDRICLLFDAKTDCFEAIHLGIPMASTENSLLHEAENCVLGG